MASAVEAKCGALYMNAQEAVPFTTTLKELGHKQWIVSIRTDNSTANGIMNQQIKRKRSKAFNIKLWWVVDRILQGQFKVDWHPGKLSISEYFTKHHPASHHQLLQLIYLYIKGQSTSMLQWCIEILKKASAPNRSLVQPAILYLFNQKDWSERPVTWTVSGSAKTQRILWRLKIDCIQQSRYNSHLIL